MDELGLIERLVDQLGTREGLAGIGDDTAVLRPDDGRVVGLDTMVEGRHFSRQWSTWSDVGWKLFASNASDLFATGAAPTAWLLSIALPAFAADVVDGLADGLLAARRALAPTASLVGGDTTSVTGPAVLSICMHGRLVGKRPLSRAGARVGERLWVNGSLGLAGAGLRSLQTGQRTAEACLQAHRRPNPRPMSEGEASRISAAIDVSDGLAIDLHRLADSSGVRLLVQSDQLPGRTLLREDEYELQWCGGDDYVVVATAVDRPGPAWFPIGEVIEGRGVLGVGASGGSREIAAVGYVHRT